MVDIEGLVYKAVETLKKLDLLYIEADIKGKREIIGSTFPEKWIFQDGEHRTGKVNEAALLIYQINNTLRHKKTGLKSNKEINPALYPQQDSNL